MLEKLRHHANGPTVSGVEYGSLLGVKNKNVVLILNFLLSFLPRLIREFLLPLVL